LDGNSGEPELMGGLLCMYDMGIRVNNNNDKSLAGTFTFGASIKTLLASVHEQAFVWHRREKS
jgi:hypothetical protein